MAVAENRSPGVLEPSGRALAADGVGIAYYELGGSGPALLLAHATGFCAAVLAPLAARLTGRFRCISFDARGHGRSDRPEEFGWYGFAADALAVVKELGLDAAAGFGHSCGAAALLLAEEAEPGTFAELYCFEPIMYPGETPLVPGLEGNPLAAGALRRRESFGSRAEALANFSTKAPFERLDPEVLGAYVANGFRAEGEGITLCCRREDEARVYAHALAHDVFAHLGEISCPVALACGEETDAIGPDFLRRIQSRLASSEMEVYPGLSHFGPLEDPATVARSVARALTGGAGSGA